MIDEWFVIAAALLNTLGGLTYLIATIKGRAKPNRVSWLLWGAAPLIAFFAQVEQGVGMPALMTLAVAVSPLIIFAASFLNKEAVWKLGKLDFGCGALSVLGLVIWRVTSIGNAAILFSIIADFLAAIPTIVKSYKAPETEDYRIYFLSAVAAAITLLAIKAWTFASFGFPLYILLSSFIIFALVVRKNFKMRAAAVSPK